jgi:hypothetical protein
MKKRIQLTIPEQCHEDWDNMSISEKGRFCDLCKKQVVDFSWLSDNQIMQELAQFGADSICGNFKPDQLNRPLSHVVEMNQSTFSLLQVLLSASLSSLVTGAGFTQEQEKRTIGEVQRVTYRSKEIVVSDSTLRGDTVVNYQHLDEKITSGIVMNSNGFALAGVTISLIDESNKVLTSTQSDATGRFEIPLNWSMHPTLLKFQLAGYEPVSLVFFQSKSLSSLQVVLASILSVKGNLKPIQE